MSVLFLCLRFNILLLLVVAVVVLHMAVVAELADTVAQ
jgi:hypothetical protein